MHYSPPLVEDYCSLAEDFEKDTWERLPMLFVRVDEILWHGWLAI